MDRAALRRWPAAAIVAAAVLVSALLGFGKGSGDTVRWLVRPPDSAPTVLVVVFHGHASDGGQALDANWRPITSTFLDEGWAVLSAAAYGQGWSSDDALDEYEDAVAWARDDLPSVEDVILIGQSMGGAASLAGYAEGRFADVRGWVGIAPVCDLNAMYGTAYQSSIDTAFGFSGRWDDLATAGRDPLNDYTGSDFAGLHMRFYASTSDTAVPKADHTDVMASLVSGHATESTVVSVTGAHVSADHFRASDLVDFIGRAIA